MICCFVFFVDEILEETGTVDASEVVEKPIEADVEAIAKANEVENVHKPRLTRRGER